MKREIVRKDEPGVAGLTIVAEAAPADDDPFTLVIDLHRWPEWKTIQMWGVRAHYYTDNSGAECQYAPTGYCYNNELKQYRQDNIASAVLLFGWLDVVVRVIQREASIRISGKFEAEIASALRWLSSVTVKPEE